MKNDSHETTAKKALHLTTVTSEAGEEIRAYLAQHGDRLGDAPDAMVYEDEEPLLLFVDDAGECLAYTHLKDFEVRPGTLGVRVDAGVCIDARAVLSIQAAAQLAHDHPSLPLMLSGKFASC